MSETAAIYDLEVLTRAHDDASLLSAADSALRASGEAGVMRWSIVRRAGFVAVTAAAAVAVAAAPAATALDTADAEVYVWGGNSFGMLGTGSLDEVRRPVRNDLDGLRFIEISVGLEGTTVGLTAEGLAYAWGDGETGMLGNGTRDPAPALRPVPTTMPDGVRFADVSTSSAVVLAVDTGGGVWGWGQDVDGVLGGADPFRIVDEPSRIAFPDGVVITRVLTSAAAAYAIDTQGRVWGWGNNLNGQLADPALPDRNQTPVPLPITGVSIADLIVGGNTALIVDTGGRLWGWGDNQYGQLAISTGVANGYNQPEIVTAVSPITALDGSVIAQVSTSGTSTLALTADGVALGWGTNGFGQLGTGTTSVFETAPQRVIVPDGVRFTSLVAGTDVSLAISNERHAFSWGDNSGGALGDGGGPASGRLVPGRVDLPGDAAVLGLEMPVDDVVAAVAIRPPADPRLAATGTALHLSWWVAGGAAFAAGLLAVSAHRRRAESVHRGR